MHANTEVSRTFSRTNHILSITKNVAIDDVLPLKAARRDVISKLKSLVPLD